MVTKRKIQQVEQLTELLSNNRYLIATDYRGLSVAEIQDLRAQLRNIGAEYHVVKNNLARLAADNADKKDLSTFFTGPTALAFSKDDISQLAKVFVTYIRSTKSVLTLKGGLLDGQTLNTAEVNNLASLPSIEVLRAKLLGLMLSPILSLQYVLSANMRGLNTVLNARIQQLGGTTNV